MDNQSAYFELRNFVCATTGKAIQQRIFSDGHAELWTALQFPVLEGPMRGQVATTWVKLGSDDLADAFARFDELVEAEDQKAREAVAQQLIEQERAVQSRPPPIALPRDFQRGRRFR